MYIPSEETLRELNQVVVRIEREAGVRSKWHVFRDWLWQHDLYWKLAKRKEEMSEPSSSDTTIREDNCTSSDRGDAVRTDRLPKLSWPDLVPENEESVHAVCDEARVLPSCEQAKEGPAESGTEESEPTETEQEEGVE